MKKTFTLIAISALSLLVNVSAHAEDAPAAASNADPNAIKGNPPADQPFGKLKIGMKYDEAMAILGKPTAERGYCTGKQRIPFYMGRDRAFTEYAYKGQGKVYFYSDLSTITALHGAIHSCSAKDPFELARIEYDPNDPGEVSKK